MPVILADLAKPPAVENPYSFPLDPFQMCAVDAINKHQHVLVTAKTGSGKTLVGEYQIKVSLAKGKRVFYTTPIKSLSNQKFHDLKHAGISTGIMTGDIKFAPQSDVVVMTTEILCNLLFKPVSGATLDLSLDNVDAIIFDEVHYINDRDRGKVWEQCILMLPPHINLILLSATLSEADKFAGWISTIKNDAPVHLISTLYRVVPLVHMVGKSAVVMDERDRFHEEAYTLWRAARESERKRHKEHAQKVAAREKGQNAVARDVRIHSFEHQMNTMIETLRNDNLLPALFFVFSRKKCEQYASKVTHDLITSSESADVRHIVNFHLHRYDYLQTSPQFHALFDLLQKGIAFHHSGLVPILKEIVEILFSRGLVKVLFATETFAVGINMPTKTVVFTSYTKHDDRGVRMLRTAEYIQMAGRAGRRGKDDKGYVWYLPDSEPATTDEVRAMMTGKSAKVTSQMMFDYDFLIRTFYGQGTDWRTIAKQTYWYAELQECVRHLETDKARALASKSAIHIREDALREIEARNAIDTTVKKPKERQRLLQRWNDEHVGPLWKTALEQYDRITTLTDEITALDREIENLQAYEETIQPSIDFLSQHGFLSDPLGKYAACIHEGHALMMALAFERKIFHGLPRDQLLGCLMLLSKDAEEEQPLSFCELLSRETLVRVDLLELLVKDIRRTEKQEVASWELTPYWVDVVIRWMRGDHLSAICHEYEIYEGNAIRALLKLANIAEEWTTLATLACDLEQLELMRDIRQAIVHGAVAPESLYLRI